MKVVDAISEILKREGVEFLSCYPTNTLIEAAASAGIKPLVCRQERVGVGIADGFTRITNGKRIGVFTMQAGPGAENAFSGITTAYSDSVPILLLPVGHARNTSQVFHFFRSVQAYAPVTKWTEEITLANQVPEIMRRAFSYLKMGRLGPVLVEIPNDAAVEEFPLASVNYTPVKRTVSGANARDIEEAAKVLVQAKSPVIIAGQGVLYAEAADDLVELAELLQAPVTTTLEGKSAFPEHHPLSLGTGAGVMPRPVQTFLQKADVVLAIGASLTKQSIVAAPIPGGKVIIHATNDERDINKHYPADYPILGDAKPVLRQFIEATKDLLGAKNRDGGSVAAEIKKGREEWMAEWMPKLTSNEKPINPYRVMWEFMNLFDREKVIVTHDAGSPRNQLVPFYQAPTPRSYIGWGKSHALGTGLGLIMGAKLAAPDKFCVNFMGDAAFGMTGLDFETAVRCNIPILTIVLNNNFMAAETHSMHASHERYGTMNILGNYADLARSLGGWSERVEEPGEIVLALKRARKVTDDGKAALLEFITSREINYSRMRD
ncbi:MAG: thiamine pyrophosphate-requiring protein [Deltaproteobacteria bacterium]|nr:thiamine pyrophosphate-requiring protein [Deltaproteobacteria bacterium]MDZ4342894.1 thiamine pyrophosphate-requiring protein [Candidatus Binatia bacterium]